MLYIKANHLKDGLYNIKDGEIFKYKAKGGTVRTYEIGNIVRCKECRLNETDDCPMVYYTPLEDGGIETRWWNRPDDYCSWGEREGE